MISKGTRLRYHYYRGGFGEVSQTVLRHFVHGLLYHYNKQTLTDHPKIPRLTVVDPSNITISTIPRHRFPSRGTNAFLGELAGVWDHFQKTVEETSVYRSLYERFEEGCRWEETELYRSARWKLDHKDGASVEQLEQRCKSIDQLYEDIKANGYVTDETSIKRVEKSDPADRVDDAIRVGDYLIPDEPRVGIGRDGTYIRLGGGRHRIAIARLLNLDEIPAVVLIQHPDCEI